MTAIELFNAMAKLPPDAEVLVYHCRDCPGREIGEVKVERCADVDDIYVVLT